jgi:1,6-anhydro-N-acetylmuramate kinase
LQQQVQQASGKAAMSQGLAALFAKQQQQMQQVGLAGLPGQPVHHGTIA